MEIQLFKYIKEIYVIKKTSFVGLIALYLGIWIDKINILYFLIEGLKHLIGPTNLFTYKSVILLSPKCQFTSVGFWLL